MLEKSMTDGEKKLTVPLMISSKTSSEETSGFNL
jgi:hypothetical protein